MNVLGYRQHRAKIETKCDGTDKKEEEKSFKYVNLDNEINYIELDKHSLAFTVCQVPVIYNLSDKENIRISYINNSEKTIEGHELDIENSESIFNRTNLIKAVYVSIVKWRK